MISVKYILFDAANTLIHKPQLWEKMHLSFERYGFAVPDKLLKKNHKIVSEYIHFPDNTSKDFYDLFNSELLYSLGILPNKDLLDDIFYSCTYLPWEKFSDTRILNTIQLPIGILSNFSSSLNVLIGKQFGDVFKHIFISENYGVAKPSVLFYEKALNEIGFNPKEILYIGDSIKLDIEPSMKINFKTLLIDRENVFPVAKNRITSLEQIILYL